MYHGENDPSKYSCLEVKDYCNYSCLLNFGKVHTTAHVLLQLPIATYTGKKKTVIVMSMHTYGHSLLFLLWSQDFVKDILDTNQPADLYVQPGSIITTKQG